MKKSLIAFAALATIAGAASAQSSVTLYGRVDLSIGKNAGTAAKSMQNGSGSRFGVRGVEDLGGGMSAFFNVEHRFDADTGASSDPARFWTGRSIVGLQGGFGKLTLGREYTTAFLGSQLTADPWGWDTVATDITVTITGGGRGGNTGAGITRLAPVRNDSSLTYNFAAAGFSFGAQIAEATDTINGFQKKPFNFAVGYAAGPFTVGMGYDRSGREGVATEKWTTFNAAFNLGAVKLGGFYGTGNNAADDDRKAYMFTAVAPMGQGEFRAAYGKVSNDLAGAGAKSDLAKGFALGYHYALSKRTTLYTDFSRNTARATDKTAYDFGIKHNF
jgi:predicted porin